MKKLLIIDDDAALGLAVKTAFHSDFQVFVEDSGAAGVATASREVPDLILLDLHLPDLKGFEVCKRLREQPKTLGIPIIFLTGDASPEASVEGFHLGADDFVTKPFHAKVLRARIDARLKTGAPAPQKALPTRVGNLEIEYSSRNVKVNGVSIVLTTFEYEMLVFFLARTGELVLRKTLLSHLWPDSVVSERTVDTHIAHLRKKLSDFDHHIKTVHRAGYQLLPNQESEGT